MEELIIRAINFAQKDKKGMKILTADKIREADAYTIRHEPIASIDLMERAARQLLNFITKTCTPDDHFTIFTGPGNNGGDGWALTRMLWAEGFNKLEVYLLNISSKLSVDSDINRKRLAEQTKVPVYEINSPGDFPAIAPGDIVIDALFGSGLSRPLEGMAAELVNHINKHTSKAVIAIDIPSGLFSNGDAADAHPIAVKADITLSFQFPKLTFLFPEHAGYVGRWEVLPIGLHKEFISQVDTPYYYVTSEIIQQAFKPRGKFSHKGNYGHALLIAGSYGMMGAAVLAARAAVRSGTGLLTSHLSRLGVEIMQTAVPESLISIDESDLLFTEHPPLEKFTAIGIGPGLNQKPNTKKGLIALLKEVKVPLVIDADALNLLATVDNWPEMLPADAVLTPHPKEFERLFGAEDSSYSRVEVQRKFSKKHKVVIVLKGAHTCTTDTEGRAWFNSTGNPGMATGGSGDVLTGIILGLLAQGYIPADAARIGVFIHGKAGDIAAAIEGQTALTPSDMITTLGKAFHSIEK